MAAWTGQTLLSRYKVGRPLGAGGMAAVYEAEDLRRKGWKVAVKHPLREGDRLASSLNDEQLRDRFRTEVEKLIELGEIPGVVWILDQGDHDGVPFYVMRFMPGGSLVDRLAKGMQAPDEVLAWARPVARALDRLHARTPMLVHRDLKPHNILFDADGGAHLADFGIVKELNAAWATTGVNTAIGTPIYMAPEQLLPDGELDGTTDQYALAATMYHALAGCPPSFETTGGSPAQGRLRVQKRLKPVGEIARHVPPAASAAISKGLAKAQDDRFGDCVALVDAFEKGLAADSGTQSPVGPGERTTTPVTSVATSGGRSPKRALVLGGLLLAALGGGGFFVFRKSPGDEGRGTLDARPPGVSHAAAPTAPPSPAPSPSPAPTPPSKPPDASRKEPWEAPLAEAEAAVAKDDGESAKVALAKAVQAGVPVSKAAEVQAFVAAWDRSPELTISAPAEGARVQGGGGFWSVEVKGTLVTGRKADQVLLGDLRGRTGPGEFTLQHAASSAGPQTIRVEVRFGTTVRAERTVHVEFVERTSDVPAWAAPLLSAEQRAEAQRLGKPAAFEDSTTGLRFVLVPGGTFTMGSPASEEQRDSDESPQHQVTLSPFYLSIHETTNAQYRKFKSDHKSGTNFDGDRQPVVEVSHDDATAFVGWLNQQGGKKGYRLPSEAMWEYACRAGTKTPFSFGETISTDQANYDGNFTYGKGVKGAYRQKTTDVGSFPANPWGLFDMHGNAWEWCSDWKAAYGTEARRDPEGPTSGSSRVLRGGSWFYYPGGLRSADRTDDDPAHHGDGIGFRVALPASAL